MLADMLNLPVIILQRSTAGELDDFGGELTVTTQIDTVGELQQQQRREDEAAGETSDTRWLLILPAGTDVRTGDAVIASGQTFELIGDPWHARSARTRTESHVEVTLRRVAAAGDDS